MKRECKNCGDKIPWTIKIDGRRRNLRGRKFCLGCSPFGSHNTKSDLNSKPLRSSTVPYAEWPEAWKKNHNKRIARRRKERRAELIRLHGGKCCKCSYDKSQRALHFHHKKPKDKSFELNSMIMTTKPWNIIIAEAKKCILVCANCHYELHDALGV